MRVLRREGVEVIEVIEINQPDRAARRNRGKTDAVDADAAARAVLSGRATATPKSADGPAADMLVLRLAKKSAVKARTRALNQLKAGLPAVDPALRESLDGPTSTALASACAQLVGDESQAVFTMRLLARRIQCLSEEVKELNRRTVKAVRASWPALLVMVGVGPGSAAAVLIAAGDNPERLADEAAFAALCGVSPIEQSSGKTQRRRLNRGGNRQANAALYRIVQSRLRWDQRTQAHLQRRTAEGMSRREIIRCLERYVARELYRHLEHQAPATTA